MEQLPDVPDVSCRCLSAWSQHMRGTEITYSIVSRQARPSHRSFPAVFAFWKLPKKVLWAGWHTYEYLSSYSSPFLSFSYVYYPGYRCPESDVMLHLRFTIFLHTHIYSFNLSLPVDVRELSDTDHFSVMLGEVFQGRFLIGPVTSVQMIPEAIAYLHWHFFIAQTTTILFVYEPCRIGMTHNVCDMAYRNSSPLAYQVA
jgi:hypothetical protein